MPSVLIWKQASSVNSIDIETKASCKVTLHQFNCVNIKETSSVIIEIWISTANHMLLLSFPQASNSRSIIKSAPVDSPPLLFININSFLKCLRPVSNPWAINLSIKQTKERKNHVVSIQIVQIWSRLNNNGEVIIRKWNSITIETIKDHCPGCASEG